MDDLYAGDDSSGLLTHFVGRVKDSVWSTFFAETEGKVTNDFANDTALFWHVDVLDILQGNYEASGTPPETILTNFNIGKGWMVDPENPHLVEHPDDTDTFKKKFHGQTGFMTFVYLVSGQNTEYEGFMALDGDGDDITPDLTGVRAVHAKNKVSTLRDSRIWNNLIFEFRGIGRQMRGQTQKPRARAYPVKYMGYDESDSPQVSGGETISTASSNGWQGDPTAVQQAWEAAGADESTVAMLLKLYGSASDATEFVGNASMLPQVKGSEALAQAVAASVGT